MADIASIFNVALVALNNRDAKQAEEGFRRVLQIDASHVPALNLLTVVLMSMSRFAEAEPFIARAVALNQNSDVSFYNYGLIAKQLNKPRIAYEQFTKAIKLNPKVAETWNNRGAVSNDLCNYTSAIADFDKAIELNRNYADAYANKGKSLSQLRRYDQALAAYDHALSIRPDLEHAWLGRGNVFADLKKYDEAIADYTKALSIKPNLPLAWASLASVFVALRRYKDAINALDKAMASPDRPRGIASLRVNLKLMTCDWSDIENEAAQVVEAVRAKSDIACPFHLLSIDSTLADQLICARQWAEEKYPSIVPALWKGETYKHDKIRVAYLSPDFNDHAIAFLISEVFECHDREKFEVLGISFGRDDKSAIRARIMQSFDGFHDVRDMTDLAAAELIKSLEIDIAVDLANYTENSRPQILVHRPAPIQVSYLGVPVTMGTPSIDYAIADKIVLRPDEYRFWTEKIISMPDSYLVHDTKSKRMMPAEVPARSHVGLPEKAVVFCAFNNTYKLNREVFDSWMRILKTVDGSVLWLSRLNDPSEANLKRYVAEAGVDVERVIFAPRLAKVEEHLSRHRAADLFLDTKPYNAHTTAADALWAGLPVVTLYGNTFPGRVAASLLKAIGLPELITHSREEYEALVVELASNREKLLGVRQKLAKNRLTTPLFDTALFTRHLEAAFESIHRRHQAGMPPDHIQI